jgi:hypothetical protein
MMELLGSAIATIVTTLLVGAAFGVMLLPFLLLGIFLSLKGREDTKFNSDDLKQAFLKAQVEYDRVFRRRL